MHHIGQRRSKKTKQLSLCQDLSSGSSHSSRISTNYVHGILEKLKNNQTRHSTSANYLGIWRHLNKFIISLDYRDHLSWEEKTALFGAYLVDEGIQSTTLKSYFSAIKHILKQDGYKWNDNKVLLSLLVKSCKLKNDILKVRLPIQKGLFEMLLFEIERYFGSTNQQPYLEVMYKAMFCLAYYGMMKVGELTLGDHTLRACNIPMGDNKDKIMVVLYTSKTHGKESRPQRITRSPRTVCRAVFLFLCILNVVVIFYYIFINVQLLWLLHSIGPSP